MSELTKCNHCSLQGIIQRYGVENVKIVAEGEWIQVLYREGECTCQWKNMPNDPELHRAPCKRQWRTSGYHFLALTATCVC